MLTVGKIDIDDSMRAVVHNKSNLAAPGTPLAFGFDPASGFNWLGELDISIDDLLNGRKQTPENQFAKACKLIEDTLANGPVPAVEIMRMAEEQGISPKTLNRAKSALGIISIKRRGQWYWEKPAEYEAETREDGQEPQDGHASEVTTLAIISGKAH